MTYGLLVRVRNVFNTHSPISATKLVKRLLPVTYRQQYLANVAPRALLPHFTTVLLSKESPARGISATARVTSVLSLGSSAVRQESDKSTSAKPTATDLQDLPDWFLPAFTHFLQTTGHGFVPERYVVPSAEVKVEINKKESSRAVEDGGGWPIELQGKPLGKVAHAVRHKKRLTTPTSRKALSALGFIWDIQESDFEFVCRVLRLYRDKHGHLCPSEKEQIPKDGQDWPDECRGFNIGNVVSVIRCEGAYIQNNPERRAQLTALGFDWELRWEKQFRKFFKAIEAYKEIYGDTIVPKNFKIPVTNGQLSLRADLKGNNVGTATGSWPEECQGYSLGEAVHDAKTRGSFFYGDDERTKQLKRIGFEVIDPFIARINDAVAVYKAIYGHAKVPRSFKVPRSLSEVSSDHPEAADGKLAQWPLKLQGMPLGLIMHQRISREKQAQDRQARGNLSVVDDKLWREKDPLSFFKCKSTVVSRLIHARRTFEHLSGPVPFPYGLIVPASAHNENVNLSSRRDGRETPGGIFDSKEWPADLHGYPVWDKLSEMFHLIYIDKHVPLSIIARMEGAGLWSEKLALRLLLDSVQVHQSTYGHSDVSEGFSIPMPKGDKGKVEPDYQWPLLLAGRPLGKYLQRVLGERFLLRDDDSLAALSEVGLFPKSPTNTLASPYANDWFSTPYKVFIQAYRLYREIYGPGMVSPRFKIPFEEDDSMPEYNFDSRTWFKKKLVGKPWPEELRGLKLGKIVREIKLGTRDMYGIHSDHPERRQELSDLGFIWEHVSQHSWDKVYSGIVAYKKIYGHTSMKNLFVVPAEDGWPPQCHGMGLGQTMSRIRASQIYVRGHPERRAMLEDLGVVFYDHSRSEK